jgi:hypothetical protein
MPICIWATPVSWSENARCFLEPFPKLGLADLSISEDVFHYENREENAARRAFRAAKEMGLPTTILALAPGASGPETRGSPREEKKGVVSGGSIMFRGWAAVKLSQYADAATGRNSPPAPTRT